MKNKVFTAYIEWDPETSLYVEIIPGTPGAYIQAGSLDEVRGNLKEVLEVCLSQF
jgi:predicted RNase H-like HicB family nuclease